MYIHICLCAQTRTLWDTSNRKDQEFELLTAVTLCRKGGALQDAMDDADKSQKIKTGTKFVQAKNASEIGKFQKVIKSFRC